MDRVIALIPARGGSKGLPGKNIRSICGSPLIQYSIDAAINSALVDKVYVSTDDHEIAEVSQKGGADVIERPKELALDTSTTDEVITHFIQKLGLKESQLLVLLQPTSPLRDARHVDESIHLFNEVECDLVMSVTQPVHHPMKSFKVSASGKLEGLFDRDSPFMPRQSLPCVYIPNGAIYIFSCKKFNSACSIPRDNIIPYVMSSRESADIDTLEDVIEVERILKDYRDE